MAGHQAAAAATAAEVADAADAAEPHQRQLASRVPGASDTAALLQQLARYARLKDQGNTCVCRISPCHSAKLMLMVLHPQQRGKATAHTAAS